MALVTGPFLSVDASGTVYNLLTASIWKGRNYMRGYFIPTNPRTDDQITQRNLLADAVETWQGLTDEMPVSPPLAAEYYKDQWDIAARDVYPPISGYNYYVMQYCLQKEAPTIPAIAPVKTKKIHGN
ncbi:hypothetical protein ES708_03722 [subsurface metagenome]